MKQQVDGWVVCTKERSVWAATFNEDLDEVSRSAIAVAVLNKRLPTEICVAPVQMLVDVEAAQPISDDPDFLVKQREENRARRARKRR